MSDMSTGRNGGDVYIAVQTQLKFTDNAFYGFQKKIMHLALLWNQPISDSSAWTINA